MAGNTPKIFDDHDCIRVSFGNNRNLTVSFNGEKSSGAVPENVFQLWSKCHQYDEPALAQLGLKKGANHGEIVKAFVAHIDTIWPEWNVGPEVPSIGDTVSCFFGKRKGTDKGVVEKVRGTMVSVRFRREGLVSVPADMLDVEGDHVKGRST